MSGNDQKIKELKERLQKKDTSVLLQTLKEVKQEGNHSLIPYLVWILRDTDNKDVQNKVIDILNNLNSQSAVPYLIESIESIKDEELLNLLISACWKNGLDYSDYVELFVNVFIEYNFSIALEAFTVIENATTNVSEEDIDRMISYIKDRLDNINKEKKALLLELVYMLERRKENNE